MLMMAAQRRTDEEEVDRVMGMAEGLMGELKPGEGVDYLQQFGTYVAATQDKHGLDAFCRAWRGSGRDREGEVMGLGPTVWEQARLEGWQDGRNEGREEGRQEGRQEGEVRGEQRGRLKTAEGMLRLGMGWGVIEEATGLSEAEFRSLRERFSESDG